MYHSALEVTKHSTLYNRLCNKDNGEPQPSVKKPLIISSLHPQLKSFLSWELLSVFCEISFDLILIKPRLGLIADPRDLQEFYLCPFDFIGQHWKIWQGLMFKCCVPTKCTLGSTYSIQCWVNLAIGLGLCLVIVLFFCFFKENVSCISVNSDNLRGN